MEAPITDIAPSAPTGVRLPRVEAIIPVRHRVAPLKAVPTLEEIPLESTVATMATTIVRTMVETSGTDPAETIVPKADVQA